MEESQAPTSSTITSNCVNHNSISNFRSSRATPAAIASMRALVSKYSSSANIRAQRNNSTLLSKHAPKAARWLRIKRKVNSASTETSCGDFSFSTEGNEKGGLGDDNCSSGDDNGSISWRQTYSNTATTAATSHATTAACATSNASTAVRRDAVLGPQYPIPASLQILMQALKTQSPVPPDHFLQTILKSRGCPLEIFSMPTQHQRTPSLQQVSDYNVELVRAVKESDVITLNSFWEQGRTMTACNKFGESILHIACKQSNLDTVRYLLGHGADLSAADDYGRTPLHDACWRIVPDFDIIALLLSINANLLLQSDKWGFSPLMYTNREHWTQWCSFLYFHRNSLWPLATHPTSTAFGQPADAATITTASSAASSYSAAATSTAAADTAAESAAAAVAITELRQHATDVDESAAAVANSAAGESKETAEKNVAGEVV